MRVLIDGYNLLAVSKHADRETLVAALARYRVARGHEITVVFDGTRGIQRDGSVHRTAGIEVIFSPVTLLADDTIEELLESGRFRDGVVVSSDRRLQKASLRAGATYAESHEFVAQMGRALRGEGAGEEDSSEGIPGQKLSKTERARRRKLKKL